MKKSVFRVAVGLLIYYPAMKKRNLLEELIADVDALRQEREDSQNLKTMSFDPQNPPPLTNQQLTELEVLAARSDDEIDTSDIPVMSDEEWKQAKPIVGRFYKSRREC